MATSPKQSKQPARRGKREAQSLFLSCLGEGFSIASAARSAGVARATLYRWRTQSAGFARDWEQAIESGTDRLEDEARRRAVDGVERPVFRGGEVVGHVRDYSDAMLMFLLKARRPEIFAGRQKHQDETPQHADDVKATLHRKFTQITSAKRPS